MDKQLLTLMEDISAALNKYVSAAKMISKVESTAPEIPKLIPSTPAFIPEEADSTDVAVTAAETSEEVPEQLVKVDEPAVEDSPTESSPFNVGDFPFSAAQINQLKRKQLRDLIVQYELPIRGPNGESAAEMLVAPLREAVRTYILTQEMHAAMAAKAATETTTKSMTAVADFEEAQVDAVEESADNEEAAPVELTIVQEPEIEVVSDEPTDIESESPSRYGNRGQQFLQWVLEQGDATSLDTIDPNKYAEKTSELASFFETNLPYVHGPDREPLDAYFEKMSCQANCASCPNGNVQAIFCYGMFDEEVTALNIKDAVESDQYFKLDADTGSFLSSPTV